VCILISAHVLTRFNRTRNKSGTKVYGLPASKLRETSLTAMIAHGFLVTFGLMLNAAEAEAQITQVTPAPNLSSKSLNAIGANSEKGDGAIIVTATRRQADILTVPLAISVFDQRQLDTAGITNPTALSRLSSSFNFTSSVSDSYGAVIRIRGVGSSGSNPGVESAAGIYIDGVYRSRAGLAAEDIPGLDRIELIRGPQGTFFGKNTTAGVVNITTALPAKTLEIDAEADAGNYRFGQAQLAVSIPASETLSFRLDGLAQTRRGLISDFVNDQRYRSRNRFQLRGQFLFEPAQGFRVRVIADYLRRDEDSGNGFPYRVAPSTSASYAALTKLGSAPVAHFDADDTGRTASQVKANLFDRGSDAGISAQLDWDVGGAVITSITAYRVFKARRSIDVAGTAQDLLTSPYGGETFAAFTHETRIAGSTGVVDYLAGLFYAHEKVRSLNEYRFGDSLEPYLSTLSGNVSFSDYTGLPAGQSFRPGAIAQDDVHRVTTNSVAAFTHESLRLTSRLTISGGARYTYERKSLNSVVGGDSPGCAAIVARNGTNLTGIPASIGGLLCAGVWDSRLLGHYTDSFGEGAWSGVASADYALAKDLKAYASASRGSKAGGYNLDRTALQAGNTHGSDMRFAAETAISLEAGLKATFMGGRLRSSATLFDTRFDDYQFTYNLVLPNGATQRVTTNLPYLRTRGAEWEGSTTPITDLDIAATATYQDARFAPSGFPAGLSQLQGAPAPNAPAWIATGEGNYRPQLGAGPLHATFHVDARWQSSANVSSSGVVSPAYVQTSYATVNSRVAISGPHDRWAAELFVNNVFNKAAWTQLLAATLQPGSIIGYLNEPRFFGVRAKIRFAGV
jgi:iron complex outermembrane receptor protein